MNEPCSTCGSQHNVEQVTKGVADSWGDMYLCERCRMSKSDMTMAEWLKWVNENDKLLQTEFSLYHASKPKRIKTLFHQN